MIDSTGLGHVGHERAAREAEPVVDVDAGGERQDPLCDAGSEVGEGARPWRSSVRMSLRLWKTDSMRWRIEERWSPLSGSSLRAGRKTRAPSSPTAASNSLPA